MNSPNVGFIRGEVHLSMPKWEIVDDCVSGDQAVKLKESKYLPKPETNSDPDKNQTQYEKYLLRAVFFPVTGRTRDGLVGQVFSKPIDFDLPSSIDPLISDIDGSGNSIEQQSKRTLSTVLTKGRAGLLSDFPRVTDGEVVTKHDVDTGKYRPNVILYQPQQIINWRNVSIGGEQRLSLLILEESKIVEDDGYEFKMAPRWRDYRLTSEMQVTVTVWMKDPDNEDNYIQDEDTSFVIGGDQKPLSKIPFTFVGSTNNDSTIDDAPLYPIATLNIAHYRNSADYEQSSFICGQPTPLFTGLTDDWVGNHMKGKVMMGSTNGINLPAGATGELLQPAPNSMAKEAMDHKEDQMKAIGAKLIEPNMVERTASEVEIEATSEASILSSIAKNVSEAYETALMHCSWFMTPLDLDEITVTLNSEFQVAGLNAQERQEVMSAWQGGLITKAEAREVYRKKGIATETDEEAAISISGDGELV